MNTVISQALATGLPVIATEHSGLPDQVKDGRNGLLVPEGNAQALADSIAHLLARPGLWATYGQFGREHVKLHYDSGRLIEKQICCYRELLCGRK